MTLRGMDVERVDALAGQLQSQADRIDGIINVVDTAVSALAGVWFGENVNIFHGHWVGGQRGQARGAAADIADAIGRLRAEVAQQRASSGDTSGGSARRNPFSGVPGQLDAAVAATAGGWAARFLDVKAEFDDRVVGSFANVNDWVELARGNGNDLFVGMEDAGDYRAVLKGAGVGVAIEEFGSSFLHHDKPGMLGATADAGFTFASAPVSVLWDGLKAETGYFLPLNSQQADGLYDSMIAKGYTPDQISTRWSGFSGFTQYGNDYVDSHAPWLVDSSDKLLAPVGGWLYNHGIKL